jgi:hypothetical protein
MVQHRVIPCKYGVEIQFFSVFSGTVGLASVRGFAAEWSSVRLYGNESG